RRHVAAGFRIDPLSLLPAKRPLAGGDRQAGPVLHAELLAGVAGADRRDVAGGAVAVGPADERLASRVRRRDGGDPVGVDSWQLRPAPAEPVALEVATAHTDARDTPGRGRRAGLVACGGGDVRADAGSPQCRLRAFPRDLRGRADRRTDQPRP